MLPHFSHAIIAYRYTFDRGLNYSADRQSRIFLQVKTLLLFFFCIFSLRFDVKINTYIDT